MARDPIAAASVLALARKYFSASRTYNLSAVSVVENQKAVARRRIRRVRRRRGWVVAVFVVVVVEEEVLGSAIVFVCIIFWILMSA